VNGDLGTAVQQLKRESGKGLFVGGAKLPLALAELELIDEYEFVVRPRLAGHGPTLFAGLSKRIALRLASRLEFGSGRWRCGMSREDSPLCLLARVSRVMEQLGQIQWIFAWTHPGDLFCAPQNRVDGTREVILDDRYPAKCV
jgi:hypothetical protein